MAFYRVTKKNSSPGPGPGPLPTQKDYCKFNTYSAIMLPLKIQPSTDKIEVEFYSMGVTSYSGLLGSNQNFTNAAPLWVNSNYRLQFYDYSINTFTISNGYHKFVYDPTDGSIVIDNETVTTGKTISAFSTEQCYSVGCRLHQATAAPNGVYNGYIKRLKITNIQNNTIRIDLIPAIFNDGSPVMVDTVTGDIYGSDRMVCFDSATYGRLLVKTKSTGGEDASITLTIYDINDTLVNTIDVLYTDVIGEENAILFGCVKLYYNSLASKWYIKASKPCFSANISNTTFIVEDSLTNWSYNALAEYNLYFDR